MDPLGPLPGFGVNELLSKKPLPEALTKAEHLPTIAAEVLRLCRDKDTTLDDLAQAISSDPALAACLLRFANSSLYDLGQEVGTLQRSHSSRVCVGITPSAGHTPCLL